MSSILKSVFVFVFTLSLGISQSNAFSLPSQETIGGYVAGGIADIIVDKIKDGKVVSKEEFCKKGDLKGLPTLLKVRSVKDAKKILKGSISVRAGDAVIVHASYSAAALGLLTCSGVEDFDQSKFSKEAIEKIKKKYGNTNTGTLKDIVQKGLLKGAAGATSLTCTAVGAGLVASEVGLSAIPALTSVCGTTIKSINAAQKKNQERLNQTKETESN